MYLATFFTRHKFLARQWALSSLILCLIGCNLVRTNRLLDKAEVDISEHPDSALSALQSIDKTSLAPGRQTARYSLLLSMALDKNYIDITNDSTISFAYDYYQKHGNACSKMLSSYYAGIVHQNAGNDLQAAVEFDKALELALGLKDNHYAGLSCNHLSFIHSNNYNHVQALYYSRMAESCFDSAGEILSADYARADIASQLFREKQYDSALAITERILTQNDYPPLIRKCLWLMTELLLYGKHDYSGAQAYLEQIPLGHSRIDSLSYYGYKAIIAEKKGDSHEASRLFSIADGIVKTDLDSLTLFDQKARVYETRGDYRQAFACMKTATDIQNRKITELLGQSVTQELENHYRQSLKKEKEVSRSRVLAFSLSGILLLIVVVLLFLAIRKMHRSHVQDLVDIESLNNDLQMLRNSNDQFRKISNAIIGERVRFLRQLSDSYFSWSDEEVRKREKQNGISTREEIISRFRHQLSALRSDKQLLASIESAVDASQDNIMTTVRKVCGQEMKESDYVFLTLLFSGLSIKSISFFLKTSEPALRTRKSRYKQFFSQSDHPEAPSILARL